MASNKKKSTASNPISVKNHVDEGKSMSEYAGVYTRLIPNILDQDAAFASAQEQILLKALQDFIVPLIRVVDRKRKNGMKFVNC